MSGSVHGEFRTEVIHGDEQDIQWIRVYGADGQQACEGGEGGFYRVEQCHGQNLVRWASQVKRLYVQPCVQ